MKIINKLRNFLLSLLLNRNDYHRYLIENGYINIENISELVQEMMPYEKKSLYSFVCVVSGCGFSVDHECSCPTHGKTLVKLINSRTKERPKMSFRADAETR